MIPIQIQPAELERQIPGISDVSALSRGGQKIVFGARHISDGDVVLKLVMPGADDRIQREIEAVRTIESARVPKIYHVGTVTILGVPMQCLREQRVHGESVKKVLTDKGPLSIDETIQLTLQILEALVEAEARRIVHRDIKPDNILRDYNGNFWLIDFGIARMLDSKSLTAANCPWGPMTPGYGAPEQINNRKKDIDNRADLFALAVTAVECLSGVNQFTAGARDVSVVLKRVLSEALVVPRAMLVGQTPFAELLEAMGKTRISQRPRSAADTLAWLTLIKNAT